MRPSEDLANTIDNTFDSLERIFEKEIIVETSQRAAYFYAVLIELKVTCEEVIRLRSFLKVWMIDPYKLKYVELANKADSLCKLWEQKYGLSIGIDITTTGLTTDADEVINGEDYRHNINDLMLTGDTDGRVLNSIRKIFIRSIPDISWQIADYLEQIRDNLNGIMEDAREACEDIELLQKKYRYAVDTYRNSQRCKDAEEALERRCAEKKRIFDNDKEAYLSVKEEIRVQLKATDLGIAYMQNDGHVAEYLHAERMNYGDEDLLSFFELLHQDKLLDKKIEMLGMQIQKARVIVIPDCLKNEKATAHLNKLVVKGWLDADYQPVGLTGPKVALLAHLIADDLFIREIWKVFEDFWDRKNMRQAYIAASKAEYCSEFIKEYAEAVG